MNVHQAKTLTALRIADGNTLEDTAVILGITRSKYQRLASGESELSLKDAMRIALFYNIEVLRLLDPEFRSASYIRFKNIEAVILKRSKRRGAYGKNTI